MARTQVGHGSQLIHGEIVYHWIDAKRKTGLHGCKSFESRGRPFRLRASSCHAARRRSLSSRSQTKGNIGNIGNSSSGGNSSTTCDGKFLGLLLDFTVPVSGMPPSGYSIAPDFEPATPYPPGRPSTNKIILVAPLTFTNNTTSTTKSTTTPSTTRAATS